ncbi:MAG: hypothetical protein DRQ88_13300 [Epsilonproteobacteria bacterium]|nr:MAG: hypothetical protein DRQ88_13300 [Campylobacterota bacterium]
MVSNMVPVQSDLTEDTPLGDIIRGLETVIREDMKISAGALFGEGDWAVLNDAGELVAPGVTGVANTFMVWAGNAEGRTDVHATGNATVLTGGHYVYRTTKYDPGPAYTVGEALTVKDLGGGEMVPTTAIVGTDAVIGRVRTVPTADNVMEIEVVAN